MSLKKSLISGILFALALSACGQKNRDHAGITLVSASKIANSGAPAKEKAEEYGKAAELLLTAQGISQAHKLAQLGLQQDPKNLRAGFAYAISSVMINQKGIYARVWPLVEKDPKALRKHKLELANIKAKSGLEMYNFLMDGKPDIDTEVKLQDHFQLVANSFEQLRQFVRANKDSELTIKANTTLVSDLVERYTNACEIKETANLEYELVCPPHHQRYNVTLNRADFEAIGYMAAIMKMYILSLNAYDLSGSASVALKFSENTSADIIVSELSKNPAFGTLRKQARLQEINSLGLDLVGGLNWAMKNQSTLCPKGESNPKNRIGKWMNNGLCLHPSLEPHIDMIGKVFKGEVLDSTSVKGDTYYTAKAAYGAFFQKPPQDLRSLGPFKFDACNNLIGVGDPTLAGVFPQRDANIVLPLASPQCGAQ